MTTFTTYGIAHNKWRFRNPDNWRVNSTVKGLYPKFDVGAVDESQTAYARRLIENNFEIIFRMGFFTWSDQTSQIEVSLVEDTGGGGDDGTSIGVFTYEFTGSQYRLTTSWGTVLNKASAGFYDIKIERIGSTISAYHKFNGIGPWVLEPSTVQFIDNINCRIIYSTIRDTYFSDFIWTINCGSELCLQLDENYFWTGFSSSSSSSSSSVSSSSASLSSSSSANLSIVITVWSDANSEANCGHINRNITPSTSINLPIIPDTGNGQEEEDIKIYPDGTGQVSYGIVSFWPNLGGSGGCPILDGQTVVKATV